MPTRTICIGCITCFVIVVKWNKNVPVLTKNDNFDSLCLKQLETIKYSFQIYYYAENQTTHTNYPDGLEILSFPK